MSRLRTVAYIIVAGLILACGLLASRAVASPAAGVDIGNPWGAGPGATIPTNVVFVSPGASGVTECGVLNAAIELYSVTDAIAADVTITFDPTLFYVMDEDGGQSGTQILPSAGFMAPGTVDANLACNLGDTGCTPGTIRYAVSGVNPGATGSGAIASFRLRANGDGYPTVLSASGTVRNSAAIVTYLFPSSPAWLQATALGVTTVGIEAVPATTARLDWSAVANAAGYRIYSSPTAPYFVPAEPAFGTSGTQQFDHTTALGAPDTHTFYVVKGACTDTFAPAGYSNRTGAWNYLLVKGTP